MAQAANPSKYEASVKPMLNILMNADMGGWTGMPAEFVVRNLAPEDVTSRTFSNVSRVELRRALKAQRGRLEPVFEPPHAAGTPTPSPALVALSTLLPIHSPLLG